jgi:mannose-6-phosphate isomerase-like protein (cupin superfamily)
MTRRLRPAGPPRHAVQTGPEGESICRPAEDDEFASRENVRILESWNTETDRELSIARARLGPGDATESHYLEGITERYLVIQGTGMVRVGSLRPSEVGPGDVVFIPAGVMQQITNTGSDDLVFYCICTPAFQEDRYAGITRFSPDESNGP